MERSQCTYLLYGSWAESAGMVYRRRLKESSTALHTVRTVGETSVSLRKQESSLVCARFIHTWIQLGSQQMFSGVHIKNATGSKKWTAQNKT